MDDTDQQLLGLLRANARASVASLAKTLRVARGTVQNRISKLEASGTIVGYTVRLKPQTDTHRIAALMTIAVEGNRAEAVLRALRGDPAVQARALEMGARLIGNGPEAVTARLARERPFWAEMVRVSGAKLE
jgi:DNA-binding Lrp family transcriptional regulator